MSSERIQSFEEPPLKPVLNLVGRRSLHKDVVEEIGRKIINGAFPEDSNIPPEAQLASDLGVSRNVLREAIKVLIAKGLLQVRPRTGTQVRPASQWNLLDPDILTWQASSKWRLLHAFNLAEFRLIVEPKASYFAAKRATDKDIAAIRDACAALEACVGHPNNVAPLDIAFHMSIHRASHNALLVHMGTLVSSLMQFQVQLTTIEPGSFERGLPLHRQLAEAITDRDAPKAAEISRALCEMPYMDLANRIGHPADFLMET